MQKYSRAQYRNKQNQENAVKMELLSIIAKRQQCTSVKGKDDWPGLRRPNFGSFSQSKFKSSIKQIPQYRQFNSQSRYITKISLVESSKKFLSLYPSKTETNFHKKKLNKSTNKQLIKTAQQQNKKVFNNTQIQKNIKINQKKTNNNQLNQQDFGNRKRLKDYIIDFQAFNYISKIIDTPDSKIWAKFVHPKENNN